MMLQGMKLQLQAMCGRGCSELVWALAVGPQRRKRCWSCYGQQNLVALLQYVKQGHVYPMIAFEAL